MTNGSIVSAMLGATTSTPLITTPTNARFVNYYDGAVFGGAGSGGMFGVFRVDGTAGTLLPGFPTVGTSYSPYAFVAFDRDSTAGIDVIYQCDDRSAGGLSKWTLAAGTWTLVGTFSMTTGFNCRSVTGVVDGSNVALFVTTVGTNANRIIQFVDAGGAPSSVPGRLVRTAATNTVFRGIALAPR